MTQHTLISLSGHFTELNLIINSSSLCSLLHLLPPFSPLCPAMPLSWLRVLVYDWVTLLCLWSFLSLYIFSYLPALLSLHLYLSLYSIYMNSPSSFPPLLTPSFCRSRCLSASCYCNHLFTQPVAHFLLLLTDSVWFYNAHARKSSSVQPTNEAIAANSDGVCLLVSELWYVHCMHVHMWACITQTLLLGLLCIPNSYIQTDTHIKILSTLATGCKHHGCTVKQRH